MTKYEIAKKLAEEALNSLLLAGGKDRATANEILQWVEANRPEEYEQVKRSWGSFLTAATDDPESALMREPGRYGYMLRQVSQPTVEGESAATADVELPVEAGIVESPAYVARERKLYDILANWLISKDYRAKDTSSTKNGGPWGNPDVTGLRITETLGKVMEVEVATVEAKLSDQNWERLIFEAISHKRFADRVYFAFAYGSDKPDVSEIRNLARLREYAERYRVGILVVFITPAQYEALRTGNEQQASLSLEETRVEELWPALYDPVPTSSKERFLRTVLEIQTLKDAYAFGED